MNAIAKHDILKGAILDKEKDIIFRRNVHGIDAWEIYKATNLVARKNIKKSESLTYKCVNII